MADKTEPSDEAFIKQLCDQIAALNDSVANWSVRAEAAEAALAECHETLRRLKRTGELSAAIMRDTRRTGAWEGAERTARAFERMGEFAARALAKEARDE